MKNSKVSYYHDVTTSCSSYPTIRVFNDMCSKFWKLELKKFLSNYLFGNPFNFLIRTHSGVGFSDVTNNCTVSKFLSLIKQSFERSPITVIESVDSVVGFEHDGTFETLHTSEVLKKKAEEITVNPPSLMIA